jgi:glycine/D-amino acid oxidase-like deaminating enzyme
MKKSARVGIIGGGVLGVGLLYFLTKEGWRDVVLIEKGELTSGSTWHAAGLVPHFISGLSMAKVHHVGSSYIKILKGKLVMQLGSYMMHFSHAKPTNEMGNQACGVPS